MHNENKAKHFLSIAVVVSIFLLLEASKSDTSSAGHDTQRDKEESEEDTSRKTDVRKFNIVGKKKGIKSKESNRRSIKCRRSSVDGTGDDRNQNRCRFNKKRSGKVDEQLLVVSCQTQKTEFFGDRKQLLNSGKVKSLSFQLGKDAIVGSDLQQLQLPNPPDNVVLMGQLTRKM